MLGHGVWSLFPTNKKRQKGFHAQEPHRVQLSFSLTVLLLRNLGWLVLFRLHLSNLSFAVPKLLRKLGLIFLIFIFIPLLLETERKGFMSQCPIYLSF